MTNNKSNTTDIQRMVVPEAADWVNSPYNRSLLEDTVEAMVHYEIEIIDVTPERKDDITLVTVRFKRKVVDTTVVLPSNEPSPGETVLAKFPDDSFRVLRCISRENDPCLFINEDTQRFYTPDQIEGWISTDVFE